MTEILITLYALNMGHCSANRHVSRDNARIEITCPSSAPMTTDKAVRFCKEIRKTLNPSLRVYMIVAPDKVEFYCYQASNYQSLSIEEL